jgi:S1-C subfamily serine protease
MNTSSYSWQCATCGRQVPRKVETCRCGFARPAEAPEPPATRPPAEDVSPEPVRKGPNPLLLGLFLGLALAAGMLFYLKEDAPPQQAAVAVPADKAPFKAAGVADPPVSDAELSFPADTSLATVDSPAPVAASTSSPLEDVVARTLPAVASIQAGSGRGTGFFVQRDIVITNQHVVGNETSVQLTVSGRRYQARVTRTSSSTDLAVLQVYGPDPTQPTLNLGTANGLRAGQEVVAIGSALGVLSNTVTRGIVSAVREAGSVTLVQTDAAINPGNSGGPLVDRNGIVIGVNSMKIGGAKGEGLAFAVAIDHASQLLNGQTNTAIATPLQGLNRIMTGSTASDDLREQGTAAYATAVDRAGRRADQIDDLWERASENCVARAVRAGDREWFGIYEANGLQIHLSNAANCEGWLAALRTNADTVRGEMTRAAEAARRQGVYPGVMRDIRRQNKMEWSGW